MVKLRLTRLGKKKQPFYRIIAIDSRKRRDGRYIEQLGFFNPVASGQAIRLELDDDKALKWLLVGAQPSPTVKKIFSDRGIMLKYDMIRRFKKEKVEKTGANGKKTVRYIAVTDEKDEPVRKYTDAEIEEAYNNWLAAKERSKNKMQSKTKLSKKAKAKIEAEKKAADEAKNAPEENKEAPKEQKEEKSE